MQGHNPDPHGKSAFVKMRKEEFRLELRAKKLNQIFARKRKKQNGVGGGPNGAHQMGQTIKPKSGFMREEELIRRELGQLGSEEGRVRYLCSVLETQQVEMSGYISFSLVAIAL